jgi:hypothetical protein
MTLDAIWHPVVCHAGNLATVRPMIRWPSPMRCWLIEARASRCQHRALPIKSRHVTGSFLGDLAFSPNSRSVQMSACRIANQSALTLDGANHNIIGCDVNPALALAETLTNSEIGPLSENQAPIVDNTGGNNSARCSSIVNSTRRL